MAKLKSATVSIGKIKLSYLHGGRGPPLCFLQGWGNIEVYGTLLQELSRHFTVYAPDIYQLRYSLNTPFYESSIEVISGLLKKIRFRGMLAGHSFGAAIAAGVALRVKAKKLVLIDSAGIPVKRWRLNWIYTYFRELNRESKIVRQSDRIMFKHNLKKTLLENMHPGIYNFSCEVMDLDAKDVFRQIKQTTLILWGRDDAVFPAASANTIKALIKGSRVVQVPGSHHWCLLKPEQLSTQIKRFSKKYK